MIILLNGNRPQCGKDTIAKFLVENHGFTEMKFTTCLREEMHEKLGIAVMHYDIDKDTVKYPNFGNVTYRQAMIMFGETVKAINDENYWCWKLLERMEEYGLNTKTRNIVISDWGFGYEYRFLKFFSRHEIIGAYVNRPLPPGVLPVADSRFDLCEHCDVVINNGLTLEYLELAVEELIKELEV